MMNDDDDEPMLGQPTATTTTTSNEPAAVRKPPAFPSSVDAFYPSSSPSSSSAALSEYPLFASRRSQQQPPMQVPSQLSLNLSHSGGPGSSGGTGPTSTSTSSGSGLGPAFMGSKLRRQSFLATSMSVGDGDDEDGGFEQSNSMSGYDSPGMASFSGAGDSEIAMAANSLLQPSDSETRPTSSSGNSQYSVRFGGSTGTGSGAHVPIAIRARSLSQSTNMTNNRSPPWPNSPPRQQQQQQQHGGHFLARMTSEQQQALQASAASASNAMYMIPQSFRHAAAVAGGQDDLLVGDGDDQAEDNNDGEQEEEVEGVELDSPFGRRPSTAQSRTFNPLNPYQLRNSPAPSSSDGTMQMALDAGGSGSGSGSASVSVSGDRYSSPRMKQVAAFEAFTGGSAMERTMSGESSMSASAGLRPSRSSPSLSALNAEQMEPSAFAQQQQQPPKTPPPPQVDFPKLQQQQDNESQGQAQQPLRRSQSATHRLSGSGFSAFAKLTPGIGLGSRLAPFTSTSGLSGDASGPATAPLDGSLRVMRANSFSGLSAAAAARGPRSAGSSLPPGASFSGFASGSSLTAEAMDERLAASRHRRTAANNAGSAMDEDGPAAAAGGEGKIRHMSQSSGSESGTPGPNSGAGPGTPAHQQAPRVVKRAVNHKKGSLMPKSKDHLRIISQLRLETGEFEVASEAALHRISQSTPALPAFMTPRGGQRTGSFSSQAGAGGGTASQQAGSTSFGSGGLSAGGGSSPFAHNVSPGSDTGLSLRPLGGQGRQHRPSSSGGPRPSIPMPTRNRFPESAVEDEDAGEDMDSSGSEPDYAAGASDIVYASGNEMDGDDSASNAGDRDHTAAASLAAARSAWALRDPAMRRDRQGLDMDLSPSAAGGAAGLSWSTGAGGAPRPGKRKLNDFSSNDRFESYTNYSAFKRRAVSPAASTSSVSLSPLLTAAGTVKEPPPASLAPLGPPMNGSGYGSVPPSPANALPIGIGGPSGTGSWFNSRSRASSPAPSISSSAGTTRRWMGPVPEEDREKNKVDLGKMSLG